MSIMGVFDGHAVHFIFSLLFFLYLSVHLVSISVLLSSRLGDPVSTQPHPGSAGHILRLGGSTSAQPCCSSGPPLLRLADSVCAQPWDHVSLSDHLDSTLVHLVSSQLPGVSDPLSLHHLMKELRRVGSIPGQECRCSHAVCAGQEEQ